MRREVLGAYNPCRSWLKKAILEKKPEDRACEDYFALKRGN